MVSLGANGCGRHYISKSPHKDRSSNVGVCSTGKEKVKEAAKLLCLQPELAGLVTACLDEGSKEII